MLVTEHEKSKIVDLLQKAKTIISKKVEKVMGKKPKTGISNVTALQMVLESWNEQAASEDKEDRRLEERLIREQEQQVETLLKDGKTAPVTCPRIPTVEVEGDTSEPELGEDLEVARRTTPRHHQPPGRRRAGGALSPTRSLSPAEGVPCPFGHRPDTELYPARLRRPSSLYGAGAAAASSRPASRLLSVSPSLPGSGGCCLGLPGDMAPPRLGDGGGGEADEEDEEDEDKEVEEDDEEEWEYEYAEEPEVKSTRYTRPDSFTVPIGGMWRSAEDPLGGEVKWSTVEEDVRRVPIQRAPPDEDKNVGGSEGAGGDEEWQQLPVLQLTRHAPHPAH
jgi:hypothetical protein